MNIEPIILNVTITGSGSPFTLCYHSMESVNLAASNSTNEFNLAVTAIIDGATESDIRITKIVSDDQTLQVCRYDSSLIDVAITTVQTGRFPDNLILSFPTRSTSAISLPSKQSVVEDQLHNIVSVSCTKTSTAGEIYWTHTYDNSHGRVDGILDNSINPMCGRYSLKNPKTIFSSSFSKDEVTNTIVGRIPWETYNWVSFINNKYNPYICSCV